MKNTIKLVIYTLTTLLCSVNYANAGQYSESGYLNYVKSNIYHSCFIKLRYTDKPNDHGQSGMWDCNDNDNMLKVAIAATALGSKVTVIFEGNGAETKPVLAITLTQ